MFRHVNELEVCMYLCWCFMVAINVILDPYYGFNFKSRLNSKYLS